MGGPLALEVGDGYEPRPAQVELSEAIEAVMASGGRLTAEAPTGCLAGDTIIGTNRATLGRPMRLDQLVAGMNGLRECGAYRRKVGRLMDPKIRTFARACLDDGTIGLVEVVAAYQSGNREVYRLTTEDGRSISATADHKFLTLDGWRPLSDLNPGSLVMVEESRRPVKRGTQRENGTRRNYRVAVAVHHPHVGRKGVATSKGGWTVPVHRLVAEASMNGITFEVYMARLNSGDLAGLRFVNPNTHAVHHIDRDSLNNDPENLEVLTLAEHRERHRDESLSALAVRAVPVRVAKIESVGVVPTYDLSMAGPNNFVANGFVVHNSGKSFAGAVPAALAAKARRERTIYVTANIALQEQIIGKDLPLVARVIPGFTFAIAKGMGNYVCKLAHESAGALLAPGWSELCEWLARTESGDLSELPFEVDPAVRAAVTCDSEECQGSKCPRADGCFALEAKARYRAADVVVTNYALFFIDLVMRSQGAVGIFGDYSHVILDEAHKVPDIARDHFGWDVGHWAVMRTARGLPKDQRDDLAKASDAFFGPLLAYAQSKAYSGRLKRTGEIPALAADRLCEALRVVAEAQRSEAEELKGIAKGRAVQAANRAMLIGRQIQSAVRPESDPDSAFYLEVEKDRVKVGAKPVEIGPILKAHLYDNPAIKSVTAMSATLATGAGNFDFILGELGFTGATTLELASPFDYTRATLVTPRMVDPREPTFHAEVASKVVEIVRAAKGRTLCLFTSYRSLDTAHRALLAAGLPYRILRQGEAPRTRLIQDFRDDQSSVLLGTESMWAGVDVPGESCACVVIDRLPFPSPADPIMNAITERDPEGWFFKASVPRALVAFRQGFGRLIRRQTDRGVVVCLDSRITTKSYGQKFVRSLPRGVRIANHLRVIGEVLP